MSMFPLRNLLRRIIRSGTLTVVDPHGNVETFGSGAPSVTIEISDEALAWRWFFEPDLAVGEAYMEGSFSVESGDVYDFLDLCFANLGWNYAHLLSQTRATLRRLQRRLRRRNTIPDARANVTHHYNFPEALYDAFLDADRQYSCAYFLSQNDTLEQAQAQKKKHLAAKLLLQTGQRVLDIGCGWGGLALYLARSADVEVTGITLSTEQCEYARRRARGDGLDNRVRFLLEDYRKEVGSYERIVSVGMFEHVGNKHYREYFEKIRDLLTPDGVALIHTIGSAVGSVGANPWIDKYIFPGGDIPCLSEIVSAIESVGLYTTDIEVLRLHYAETLRAWRMRFQENRARLAKLYGERFCRMWEFYLASCEAGFRHSGLVTFQVQLSKQIDTVPITRGYLL
jgi:cyclopropane-fatty-acyl-phospholipid synthase